MLGIRNVFSQAASMTPYAKKRRLLRDHRVQMRVMEDVLEHHGLTEECHAEIMDEMDNTPFWLGFDNGPGGMDETSDTEEPGATVVQDLEGKVERLQCALADQQAFIAAVQDLRAHEAMRLELERAHMQLEDHR